MTLMFREETFSKGPDVKSSEKEMLLVQLKWLLRAMLTIGGAFVGREERDKTVGQAAFAAHPRDDGW